MPQPADPNQQRPYQGRHRRPVLPHPVLGRAVEVQEQERHYVRVPRAADGLLAPRLEDGPRGGEVAEGGEGGNGRDFGVEVCGEGGAEFVHYAE